jgi:hypothetical protein
VKFALPGVIILHGFNFKEFVSITFKTRMVLDIASQVSALECYLNIVWAGIATCYRLNGRGIQSRWGARLSAPVQIGPGAHPASYTMGTGSFSEVKRPGRGVDHPPPSSADVKEKIERYLCSPSGPSWPVLG